MDSDGAVAAPGRSGGGRTVLVVGATGVLRPAVRSWLDRGLTVIAVARDRIRLNKMIEDEPASTRCLLRVLAFDIFDAAAAGTALAQVGVDDALLYVAGNDDDAENAAVDRLTGVVIGTAVRILTSRWTPLTSAAVMTAGRWPAAADRRHLLLGVTGKTRYPADRWHTPEQISRAALRVLDTGVDAVLGLPLPP